MTFTLQLEMQLATICFYEAASKSHVRVEENSAQPLLRVGIKRLSISVSSATEHCTSVAGQETTFPSRSEKHVVCWCDFRVA